MITILFNLAAFIFALGALVSIHEWGHFYVARKMGVKVLRFSVRYGKPIWRYQSKTSETEYVIGMIPLGGYVKMLDEREGPVAVSDVDSAFNNKSVWARIAIVAAGPIANFVLAIVAYWLTYTLGIIGTKPFVGEVATNTPAYHAGFVTDDLILDVDGKETQTWDAVRLTLLDQSMKTGHDIRVLVEGPSGDQRQLTLLLNEGSLLKEEGDPLRNIGLVPWWPNIQPVIGGVQAGGAAEESGLQAGDKIVSANDEAIESWREWVMFVRAQPGQQIKLTIERSGRPITLWMTPKEKKTSAGTIGFIGAYETQSADYVNKVRTTVHYGPVDALVEAVNRTWQMSALTLQVLGKMLIGEASLSNISGPVTIAQYAGQSASISLTHYISFLAMISISLGVLNLLPIPILDGGHLLFFCIEAIKKSPVSEKTQLICQQFGLTILAGLMSLAFYNDIMRLIS